MVEIINHEDTGILSLRISGKITKEDTEIILPLFEQRIEKGGDMNVYFEFKDIETYDPTAIWKDLKFEVTHFKEFNKIAIVGDKK